MKLKHFKLSKKAIKYLSHTDYINLLKIDCIKNFATMTKDSIQFVSDIYICETENDCIKTLKKYNLFPRKIK